MIKRRVVKYYFPNPRLPPRKELADRLRFRPFDEEDLLLRDEVVDLPNPPLRDVGLGCRDAITRLDFMF